MAQDSFDAIVNAVMLAESGGRRYDKQGNLLTSSKGAKGEMQVLDTTKFQPGFGVEPAKANTPEERARVGRDYLRAMVDRYGELDKALAAYNWGPGNTDKWIAAGADPKKLPAETRSYIDQIKSTLGTSAAAKPQAAPVPSAAAGAPQRPSPVARTAALGPGYQAALALSYLEDSGTSVEDAQEEAREEEYRARMEEERRGVAVKMSRRQAAAAPVRRVTPEMATMSYRSPFEQEQEPVRAADGGFIAVGYKDGGSVSDGEWKDGPPPPEVPRGLDVFATQPLEMPRGPRTARERLREMYHSARDFVEDMPTTPLGVATEGALLLADRYKLLPPAMQELMAQERMARMERRAERRARGFDEGGEVAAQDIVADRGPSVNEGTAQSRLRDFKKLDEETQQAIIQADPRRVTALYPAPASVSLPYTLSTIPGARAMYDKSLQDLNSGIRGYAVSALRSEKGVPTQDVVFLKPGRPAMDELHTRAHEAEHVLAKRGLGDARSINDKFDELMGDSKARRRFVSEALGLQDYLRNTYGITSSYFNPKQREFQGSLLPNLLFEQLAELAAVEQARNTDLTKDPTLRNTIFKDKKVREVYNAITGLRQTRLDARDLSPYTPIAEKPEGVMGFIRDKLGFAEGGEAKSEDKPEARASARGMLESLRSGEGAQAFLRGLTMLPQNIAGAPVDVATLVMRPFGYNVEKPVGGSEWLKEKSRAAGVAFQEPTDPNARALYTAGDIASNLINPAGATRAAVRGVKEVGEQASSAAKMLRDLKPPSGPDLAPAGVPAEMVRAPKKEKTLEELVSSPMEVAGSRRDWERISEGMRAEVEAGQSLSLPKEDLMRYVKPIKSVSDGLEWVKITDPIGLVIEGGAMNHSINRYASRGGYGHGGLDAFLNGTAEVYSLRNPKTGRPLVTMEVFKYDNGDRWITQIKGPSNSDPSRFRQQIFEFMDDPNLKVLSAKSESYRNTPTGGDLAEDIGVWWQHDFDDWKVGMLDYRHYLNEK